MARQLVIGLILFLSMLIIPLQAQNSIKYVKGGIPEARSLAMKEGKLFYAVFYTDWCLPCKWMDENTFAAKEVVDFVDEHYRAVRINIDDFDGYNTRQQYNVEFLPTIIIFDQGGGILAKFEESLSAKKFFDALEKHRFDMENKSIRLSSTPPAAVKIPDTERPKPPASTPPAEKKPEPTPRPVEKPIEKKLEETKPSAPIPVPDDEAVKPADKPKEVPMDPPAESKNETFVLEEKKPATPPPAEKKPTPTAPAEKKPTPAAANTAVPGSGTYYSVQVGTFSRFENADKMRNDYREIFGDGVHIKIEQSGADTIYKVMIGRYAAYETAEPLLALLRDQGMDGFIKSVNQE